MENAAFMEAKMAVVLAILKNKFNLEKMIIDIKKTDLMILLDQ